MLLLPALNDQKDPDWPILKETTISKQDNEYLIVIVTSTVSTIIMICFRPLTRHQPILLPGEDDPKPKSLSSSGAIKKSASNSDPLPLPAQSRNNLTIPVQGNLI
jgi:hypothetical protein